MRNIPLEGKCYRGLYPLPSFSLSKIALRVNQSSLTRWHGRLSHPAYRIIHKVIESNKESICDSFQHAKSHQLSDPRSSIVCRANIQHLCSMMFGVLHQSLLVFLRFQELQTLYCMIVWPKKPCVQNEVNLRNSVPFFFTKSASHIMCLVLISSLKWVRAQRENTIILLKQVYLSQCVRLYI